MAACDSKVKRGFQMEARVLKDNEVIRKLSSCVSRNYNLQLSKSKFIILLLFSTFQTFISC